MSAKAAKISARRVATGMERPAAGARARGLHFCPPAWSRQTSALTPALNVGIAEIQRQAKAS